MAKQKSKPKEKSVPEGTKKVSIRFTKKVMPYNPGEIAGFSPDRADWFVENELAEFVDSDEAQRFETKIKESEALINQTPDTDAWKQTPVSELKVDGDDKAKAAIVGKLEAAGLKTIADIIEYAQENRGLSAVGLDDVEEHAVSEAIKAAVPQLQ